jgi:hypothetical protein
VVVAFFEVEERVDPEVGLEQSHTQTPDVDLLRVLFTLLKKHLRREVQRGPDVAFTDGSSLQTAKVGYFVGLFDADDVFGFDISVDVVLVVDGHDALSRIQTDVKELAELDVGAHLDLPPQGARAQLEENIHLPVLFPESGETYLDA